MKPELLENLKDMIRKEASEEDCRSLALLCTERAEEMKKTRQEKAQRDAEALIAAAQEQARALLEKHGVEYKGKVTVKKPAKQKVEPALKPKAGRFYVNPDNPSDVFNGHGNPPKWFKAAVERGIKPAEMEQKQRPVMPEMRKVS